MKGTSRTVSTNPFTYNGLYLATFVGTKEISSANGDFTIAEFKVECSNSQYPEGLFLTDKEDTPDNDVCSMVIEAFGGTPLAEGTPAETIMVTLAKCVNKQCSVLMIPKENKKNPGGIKYHGLVNVKDFKAVQPAAMVGEVYTGEIKTTTVNKPAVNQDDLPF